MSVSGDLAQQEDVIRRLRELHDTADDEDRPRAVLLLGLAIADLVAGLPDDDARRGELAAEGLSRLAESADDSAAVTTARELLRGCLPAAASGTGPGAGVVSAGRQREAGLGPGLGGAAGLGGSSQEPDGHVAVPGVDVPADRTAGAGPHEHRRGDRRLRSGTVVAGARRGAHESDRAGGGGRPGHRAGGDAAGDRHDDQGAALPGGRTGDGQPNWPALAELDTLIADMESADDLGSSLGAPFQAADGMHHLFIAAVVMMRIMVDIRQPDVRRDQPWRDGILGLLDRADDHLRQTPPAYRPGSGDAGHAGRDVRRAQPRDDAAGPASPDPGPGAVPRFSPAAPLSLAAPLSPAPLSPAVVGRSGLRPGHGPGHGSVLSADPAGTAGSRRPDRGSGLEGARQHVAGDGRGQLQAVDPAGRRAGWPSWSGRRSAGRLGTSSADRAAVTAMLAVMHAVRSQQRSASPRPEEHPSAEEYAALIAETESALELITQSAAAGPDPMAGGLVRIAARAGRHAAGRPLPARRPAPGRTARPGPRPTSVSCQRRCWTRCR